MSDANPYSSPAAEPAQEESSAPQLPLGKLLLGLAVTPVVVAVAQLAFLPLVWLWNYVSTIIYFGPRYAVYSSSIEYDASGVSDMLIFGGINAGLFCLPLVLYGWRKRKLTPRAVLKTGFVLAGLWWVFMTGAMAYAMSQTAEFAATSTGGDPVLFESNSVFSTIVQPAVYFFFFAPLPLFTAAAVYAWWVRRLTRQATREP